MSARPRQALRPGDSREPPPGSHLPAALLPLIVVSWSSAGSEVASCRPPAPCRPARVPGPLSYWSGHPELGQGALPRRSDSEALAGGKKWPTIHYQETGGCPTLTTRAAIKAIYGWDHRTPALEGLGVRRSVCADAQRRMSCPYHIRLTLCGLLRVGWPGLVGWTRMLGGGPPDRRDAERQT